MKVWFPSCFKHFPYNLKLMSAERYTFPEPFTSQLPPTKRGQLKLLKQQRRRRQSNIMEFFIEASPSQVEQIRSMNVSSLSVNVILYDEDDEDDDFDNETARLIFSPVYYQQRLRTNRRSEQEFLLQSTDRRRSWDYDEDVIPPPPPPVLLGGHHHHGRNPSHSSLGPQNVHPLRSHNHQPHSHSTSSFLSPSSYVPPPQNTTAPNNENIRAGEENDDRLSSERSEVDPWDPFAPYGLFLVF
eukprot:TRINITY_DN20010_c0_g1::TRINITY_DN20010_c0_g1_i1::g.1327::m.1327 TRINITY_DN20010_c0_g1::TRINITY_DN20010_c0_g1_i1::g.1327  ORF type:complete len:242 (-),score=-1.31,Kri1/PF05178.7/0.1 TRINITY_DN20010_c0_g1_i1:76-801(-)